MKIVAYEDIEKAAWDRLVADSYDAWLYSTSGYVDYAIKSGNASYCFGVLSDRDELLGVFPLYRAEGTIEPTLPMSFVKKTVNRISGKIVHRKIFQPKTIRQRRLITGYSNFAIINSMMDRGRRRIMKMMFEHIDNVAKRDEIDSLEIRLVDIAPRYLPPLRREYNPLWMVGVHDHLSAPPRLAAIINLAKSIEDLKKDMDEDCRSGINKAERSGVKFSEGGFVDLEIYSKLHTETWSRTGFPPHSLQEIQGEWNVLSENSRLFFAMHNDEVISAVLLHVYKSGVMYWGGCSKFDAQDLRGNNFLLWHCIKWAKETGYLWFNVGLFHPTPGENLKEYNVGKYKSQFTKDYYEAFEARKNY